MQCPYCSWLCKTILIMYLSRLCYLSPVADPDFELRRGPALIYFSQQAFLPSVISYFFTQNKQDCPRSATAVNPLQDVLIISTALGMNTFFQHFPRHRL